MIPVLLTFLVGAKFGGVVGYLIGYIKHRKVIIIPRPPHPPHSEREPRPLRSERETIAARNREPAWKAPDEILITKTGGSYHVVSGCIATNRGQEARTNRFLDRCSNCFPPPREQCPRPVAA